MGVYKTNKPLDYKRKSALIDWIDLLRVSLPPEIGLHELLDTLKYDLDYISQSPQVGVTFTYVLQCMSSSNYPSQLLP